MRENRKKYIRDLVIAGVLLLLALLALFLFRGLRDPGAEAVVTVNGVETGRYPLKKDGVFPLNGGTNILVIADGEAWVSEADCPDKICMGMGKISRNGEFIACLPNRVLIVIEGGEETGVDGRT
ncbi:MAG: NusG domain II-containing protein [Oscillospiraceae bacterium]|nr:NusG domain II-containing protein [Oscillospiraceae bacterium]